MSFSHDANDMSGRLKLARVSAGFYKASDAISKFGWKASTYRAHENSQNHFDATTAKIYAAAFDVRAAWLLTGEGAPRSEGGDGGDAQGRPQHHPRGHAVGGNRNHVSCRGRLASGVWRERGANYIDGDENISAGFPPDPAYPLEAQSDYVIDELSLNNIGASGEILRCIDVAVLGSELRDGDFVVIERICDRGMTEISGKWLRRIGDRIELWPETSGSRDTQGIITAEDDARKNIHLKIVGKVLWRFSKI